MFRFQWYAVTHIRLSRPRDGIQVCTFSVGLSGGLDFGGPNVKKSQNQNVAFAYLQKQKEADFAENEPSGASRKWVSEWESHGAHSGC